MPLLLAALPVLAGTGSRPGPSEAGAAACPDCAPGALEPAEVVEAEPAVELSAQDWQALRAGEVLIRDREGGEDGAEIPLDVQGLVLIGVPPGRVWQTVLDFERWPGFMPLIRETEIVRRDADRVWVHQRYRVAFVNLEHTSIYDLEPGRAQVRWRLDKESHHDIADAQGRWQFVSVDEGISTLAVYEGVLVPGRAVPGFVRRMLVRLSLPRMLRRLREEALLRSDPVSSAPE